MAVRERYKYIVQKLHIGLMEKTVRIILAGGNTQASSHKNPKKKEINQHLFQAARGLLKLVNNPTWVEAHNCFSKTLEI